MAGSEGPSATNPSNSTPKIILAKAPSSRPEKSTSNNASVLMRSHSDDHSNTHRNRFSNHLVSDTWEFHADRFFDRLSDSNQDFIVIGVLGLSGAGKSTIMNELYGVDANTSGVLLPFPVQTEDTRAMARHCSIGIELRTSTERIILLDTQPVFSPSVLAEMMRPDGSSTFPVLSGETLSAELAHEIMSIQLGVHQYQFTADRRMANHENKLDTKKETEKVRTKQDGDGNNTPQNENSGYQVITTASEDIRPFDMVQFLRATVVFSSNATELTYTIRELRYYMA